MEFELSNSSLDKLIAEHCIYKDNIDTPYKYKKYPVARVTSILSKTISEEYLMYWANSLGFKHKSYRKVLSEAANIGTKAHNYISQFISNNSSLEEIRIDEVNNCIEGFKEWWKIISTNNNIEIIGTETTLSCPYFGGTYDLLLKINGKVFLVDFKTSNRISSRYFLQLAAYRYLINYNYKYDIDGCIILRMSKTDNTFEELVANLHDPKELDFMQYCHNTFFALVNSYYYLIDIERQFKEFKSK